MGCGQYGYTSINIFMVYGNTEGVKRIVLDELDSLHGMYDKKLFIDRDVLEVICRHTTNLNREISVFMSRGGELLAVGIGDSTSVPLKDIRIKRDMKRFNGIRCFHTHPTGNSKLSLADISALENNRYDCMIAIGVKDKQPKSMNVAYILRDDIEEMEFRVDKIDDNYLIKKIKEHEQLSLIKDIYKIEGERALLISVGQYSNPELYLNELQRLAETAGIQVIDTVHQNRENPDREYYVGSGKLKDIAMMCQVQNINLLIFDNALTSSQFYRIEQALGIPVLDRSMLILDIFAKHATTNAGKLQVELARMKYNLPRLLGKGVALSRQGGGMQSRGEGEKKLEKDRRIIRATIKKLSERIEKLDQERELQRSKRRKSNIKTVAFVGYTNAGKSSLMNSLTKANVAVEDKLFKTLDSVTRVMRTENNREYLLTDTVGFISRLPHEFIDAFKSTLEEVKTADLLLHVVDSSSPDLMRQYDIVLEVLESLGANAPIITVYNKSDIDSRVIFPQLKNSVLVSALLGEGIDELKREIENKLW